MKRETILFFGPAGTGKSYNLLSMVRMMPGHNFYVLDTDDDYYASTDGEDLPNLIILPGRDWNDDTREVLRVKHEARQGDFLVLDMLDTTWDHVQSYYTEQVFGQDLADFYLKARISMKPDEKSGSALDGWRDWGLINKLYFSWWQDIMSTPCHIIAMAKAGEVGKGEDREIQMLSAPFGIKPTGQKQTAHRFHSIFITGSVKKPMDPANPTASGLNWILTTYRERWKRPYWNRYVINNFFLEYGVGIAKWGTPGSTIETL